jgi:hypothetical protein
MVERDKKNGRHHIARDFAHLETEFLNHIVAQKLPPERDALFVSALHVVTKNGFNDIQIDKAKNLFGDNPFVSHAFELVCFLRETAFQLLRRTTYHLAGYDGQDYMVSLFLDSFNSLRFELSPRQKKLALMNCAKALAAIEKTEPPVRLTPDLMAAYDYLVELAKQLKGWRQLYVHLEALLQPELYARQGDGPMANWEKLEKVVDIVKLGENALLLGSPGSGKTTTLEKIVLDAAERALSGEHWWDGEKGVRIPLLLRLSRFHQQTSVLNWIKESTSSFVEDALKKGQCLVVFEALNEMPFANEDEERQKIGLLKNFMSEENYKKTCSSVVVGSLTILKQCLFL